VCVKIVHDQSGIHTRRNRPRGYDAAASRWCLAGSSRHCRRRLFAASWLAETIFRFSVNTRGGWVTGRCWFRNTVGELRSYVKRTAVRDELDYPAGIPRNMSLKYNEEFKYALKDIGNNSFKLESQFGIVANYYISFPPPTPPKKTKIRHVNWPKPRRRQSSLYRMGS